MQKAKGQTEAKEPMMCGAFTIEEAARYLRVCEKTVRRCVLRGQLVPVRIDRRVLFLRAELDRFLQASMQAAAVA